MSFVCEKCKQIIEHSKSAISRGKLLCSNCLDEQHLASDTDLILGNPTITECWDDDDFFDLE